MGKCTSREVSNDMTNIAQFGKEVIEKVIVDLNGTFPRVKLSTFSSHTTKNPVARVHPNRQNLQRWIFCNKCQRYLHVVNRLILKLSIGHMTVTLAPLPCLMMLVPWNEEKKLCNLHFFLKPKYHIKRNNLMVNWIQLQSHMNGPLLTVKHFKVFRRDRLDSLCLWP